MASQHDLSQSDAFADMLENRINGFWNEDYFTKIILPLLNLEAGGKVLDVGAGNGALTFLLARHFPEVHFTGIDITPTLVNDATKLAQKLNIHNVEFVEGDALQLPFKDESFDATVCQTVLMHLPNPTKAIAEMSRVLKKGGAFMAAEYHMMSYEKPVRFDDQTYSLKEEISNNTFWQYFLYGYRSSGHGDLKIGGRVPLLASTAGLTIVDVRMNDRVAHAFPPYQLPSDRMSLQEIKGLAGVFEDAAYQSWLTATVTAAGGTEEDAATLLNVFRSHAAEVINNNENAPFLWLANQVLMVTIARK